MTNRRDLLKAAALSAVAMPLLGGKLFGSSLPPEALRELNRIPPLPPAGNPGYWEAVRNQFMLAGDKVFFNTGTMGAPPRIVVARMVEHLHHVSMNLADWDYADDGGMMSGYFAYPVIREKIARLLNADMKEIALTENVTMAMSYVAAGMELQKGDEVLTSDQEHPGGQSSWEVKQQRNGVVFKTMALPKPASSREQILDIVVSHFTPKTRVLMLSHVITGSGAILPIREICQEARSRGIFTVIDGAQAVGHIPVDLKELGCDAYVGCFHKWMLAPAGNGFLWLSSQVAPRIHTTLASSQWNNHEDEGFRFTQRGTGSLTLLIGLEAALDFHEEIGHQRILERVKFLGSYLREELRKIPKVKIYSPEDESMCSAITVYNIKGFTGPQLQDIFWQRDRLRPRSSSEIHGLRHSTHIYNSVDEIDRCLKIIRDLSA